MEEESKYFSSARAILKKSSDSINQELLKRVQTYVKIVLAITCLLLLLYAIFSKDKTTLLQDLFYILLSCLGVGAMIGVYYLIIDNKYYYTQKLRLSAYKKDYFAIKEIITSGSRFALYLRDFETGRRSITYKVGEYSDDNKGIGNINGSMKMKKITRKFNESIPVIMLNNSGEISDSFHGHTLYAADDAWFEYFRELAEKASFILLDLYKDVTLTENIDVEIKYLVKHSKKILLFCHTNVYNALLKTYPPIKECIVLHNFSDFVEIDSKVYRVEDIHFTGETNRFVANLPNRK